ncbi:hypothetical protein RFI_20713 [Reticulomyxa filosa]|uniref:Uncharacterized protein n=1 Tax=Reticulomyxa filosa TaxID=46433 RepID=X6MSF7_RETFI|nr:hypothetical protein RFI_20713 [Reticulomyxa filosa]|eukprot:ETO16626.1 hypothetical protein RFI_20713 [Reticulomyxa filosa]
MLQWILCPYFGLKLFTDKVHKRGPLFVSFFFGVIYFFVGLFFENKTSFNHGNKIEQMHHWQPDDIRFLYDCVGKHRANLEEEIKKCYLGSDKKSTVLFKSKSKKHIRRDSKLYLKQQQMSIRNKHDRHSSMILSKKQQSDALGIKIWDMFVQSRGGVSQCTSINEDQWNIALNDNGIEVNPDLSLDLYIALLDAKDKIDQMNSEAVMSSPEVRERTRFNLEMKINGLFDKKTNTETPHGDFASPTETPISPLETKESTPPKEPENENNNPRNEEMSLEEKKAKVAIEKARMKRAGHTPMTVEHFKAMMALIRDEFAKNKKLKLAKATAKEILKLENNKYLQLIVLCQKVFDAIVRGEKLDVQATYLTDKLTEEELNDSKFILKELSSRNADWRRRLDILTHVEEHLDEYEYCEGLISDDNVQAFVYGWTAQILDDRSHLSQTACRLFPSVVSSIIGRKESAACFFEEGLLDSVFLALFTVVRGKRAPELCKIGEVAAVQIIDILANVAEGVEEEDVHARTKSHSVVLEKALEKISRQQKEQKPLKRNTQGGNSVTEANFRYRSAPRSPRASASTGSTTSNGNRRSLLGRNRAPTIDRLAKIYETAPGSPSSSGPGTPNRAGSSSPPPKRDSAPRRKIDKSFLASKIRMSKDSYNMLLKILCDHSTYASEKHEPVRAICQVLLGYLLYGIEQKHSESEDGNSKVPSSIGESDLKEELHKDKTGEPDFGLKSVRISKIPVRAFLLDIEAFRQLVKQVISQGVNDRAESARGHAMKLLQKLEKTFNHQNLEKWFDNDTLYRYTKWAKRQEGPSSAKTAKVTKKPTHNPRANQMNIAEMKAQAMKKKKQEAQAPARKDSEPDATKEKSKVLETEKRQDGEDVAEGDNEKEQANEITNGDAEKGADVSTTTQ